MHEYCEVTQDGIQEVYSTCTTVIIAGWLEGGLYNHTKTNLHTHTHTQLLTSWSSLVLS